MRLHTKLTIVAITTLIAATVQADVIMIDSRAGVACEYGDAYDYNPAGTDPCETVEIVPHSAWQPNNPYGSDAVWVSYANTGITGTATPAPSEDDPIFSITEMFTIGSNGSLEFYIWADDTAGVVLSLNGSGTEYTIDPNFSQGTCAAGSIGCEPNEFGSLSLARGAGTYSLTMDVYQVGDGTTASSN